MERTGIDRHDGDPAPGQGRAGRPARVLDGEPHRPPTLCEAASLIGDRDEERSGQRLLQGSVPMRKE